MRFLLHICLVCSLLCAGCAITPPKPKQCEGDFRPVNGQAAHTALQPSTLAQSLCIHAGESHVG